MTDAPAGGAGQARWEHFSHEADMGVCGCGPTPESAFEQAALAMTAIVTSLEAVRDDQRVRVSCEAPDLELLLVDWLNALIFEMATRNMLFSRFQVSIDAHSLRGMAWGEKVEPRRHQPAVEIKGATLTELSVNRGNGEWCARCVVDV